jgi:putative two-component system response regulator
MKTHPARGEAICRHLKSLRSVLPIIRHHHERFDGSGYPDGLRGTQIPLLARVMQIADIYDALTSRRCYKPAYSPAKALKIILEETSRGWRDPQIVEFFVQLHKDVISKHICPAGGIGRSLEALRASLSTLRDFPADSGISLGVS